MRSQVEQPHWKQVEWAADLAVRGALTIQRPANFRQQFLFCRDPGWAPDHYAVYSNLTARYWDVDFSGGVYANAPGIADKNQLFEIRRYDSTWWTIKWVGGFRLWSYYVRPNRTYNWHNPLEAKTDPLTGNHLFRITPTNLLG